MVQGVQDSKGFETQQMFVFQKAMIFNGKTDNPYQKELGVAMLIKVDRVSKAFQKGLLCEPGRAGYRSIEFSIRYIF